MIHAIIRRSTLTVCALLGAALIALIGLGFWVGHRISHRLRENRTPLVA